MSPTRRALLGTIAPLALAGCVGTGGDDDGEASGGGDSPADAPTDAPTDSPTEPPTSSPTRSATGEPSSTPTPGTDGTAAVRVRSHSGLGEILVGSDGMTLYVLTADPPGESVCTGGCAEAWPPLMVDGPGDLLDSVRADVDLGTTERPGGGLQVTADGTPLYYFARDEEPGDASGQGINGVWFVLRPDGSTVTATPTPTTTPTPTATPTDGGGGDDGY
jgi:predicted lipoprotein with Yx(FWY)xxD motif